MYIAKLSYKDDFKYDKHENNFPKGFCRSD